MNYLKILLSVALLTTLSSCATPYQPMGVRGGYSDTPMGDGKYFIKVKVNGFTDSSTAHQYLLRRAYEVCTEAGYTDFEIQSGQSNKSVSYAVTDYGISSIEKPEMSALIVCV